MSKKSVCDMCAHFGRIQDAQCAFSSTCVVSTYNLREMGGLDRFLNSNAAEPAAVVETPVAEVKDSAETAIFNPFQRGNGCMLAEAMSDAVIADLAKHTR